MLTYVIVVNDNGELKTVSQEEFEARVSGTTVGLIDQTLNAILDARAIAEGTYTPEDNDTPIEVFMTESDD